MLSLLSDIILFICTALNPHLVFSVFKNRLDYVLDVLKIHKKGFILYKLSSGLTIKARANSMDKIIILETNGMRVYTKHFGIAPTDTVIDIGAQIGCFSLLAARSATRGIVYAFEPEITNFNLLQENITINQLQNVRPFNLAITTDKGESTLAVSSKNTGGHSVVFKGNEWSGKEKIKTNSLENILDDNGLDTVNFLKMDIEGAEYQIFYSLSDNSFAKIKKIALEFHEVDKKNNGKELKKYLETKNYKVWLEKVPNSVRGILYATQSETI